MGWRAVGSCPRWLAAVCDAAVSSGDRGRAPGVTGGPRRAPPAGCRCSGRRPCWPSSPAVVATGELVVLRGNPDDVGLAALVAVLARCSAARPRGSPGPARSRWAGEPWDRTPGAWRRSATPR
ncbi:MAG TPA: acyl-CoA carboxylase subunit epsilon [Amycolatopsis sp.]